MDLPYAHRLASEHHSEHGWGTQCWGTSGRCQQTWKETEVFHILCQAGDKCCVKPKYVAVPPRKENPKRGLQQMSTA
ncbi:beta-defensin 121-like [Perognathus longimembris pacificus]|uniref:beta-defensin 121-like n=1 Tax=Perognathus longimembris pacificus TaxID=214514 RepID=UPI0020193354|nr:beta-defensin 121-like [Perognathus longimembris pacificus]